jgi:hypothetical protein
MILRFKKKLTKVYFLLWKCLVFKDEIKKNYQLKFMKNKNKRITIFQ